MKKIALILIVLFTFAISSCDNLGKRTNSADCKDRFDVQLKDGGAMWVYGGSVTDGYVKGNDENGNAVWIPLANVLSITEMDCGNGK
jgi:hypothetical protein